MSVATLFVIRGNDQGRKFRLESPTMGLGRDLSNPLQLHDTEVSRRHAELRRSGNVYTISDLGSANGTFINGERIKSKTLSSGDQVQLGSTLMLFTGPGDESSRLIAQKVNIVGRGQPGDESRIVSSLRHEANSEVLGGGSVAASSQSGWLARAQSNLHVMYHTALAISHTLDIDQLLNRIMELIFEWVEADRGCIMLVDAQTKELEPKSSRNRFANQPNDRLTISQTILDYVMEHNEGVLTSDAKEDDRWNPAASIVKLGIREAICVPMKGRYDTVGVIYIDTSTSAEQVARGAKGNKFKEEHLKLMVAIGHQAALAVEDTRYYSAMVEAERMAAIGQTVATLSHHIKNILQGIHAGSYLIDHGLQEHNEELIRKGWGSVERNQEKISNLVLDMLSFSKEREPDMMLADLNGVVADVFDLQHARAQDKGVALEKDFDQRLPQLLFDPDGLHRAVLNIVTNAIDACDNRENARVVLRTRYFVDEGLAQVIVEDNGEGIPADRLENIFTPFISSKGNRGTGLGLSVSQKILKEHGGRIHVDSTPGEGSLFQLEFPVHTTEGSDISRTEAEPWDEQTLGPDDL